MPKVKILSIDGGGIRGILAGVVLTRLEEKLQILSKDKDVKLADFFDLFSGTSTGGILTLSYLIADENQRPLLSAQEAVDLYLKKGGEIFDVSLWQKIKSGGGILDEKYDEKSLEASLEATFKDLTLKDLIKPCIISSYDVWNGKPHFFKQHKSENKIYNYKIKDVARATSAAPTYFEAAQIENEIGTSFTLVDGGTFANNPSMVAYSEARAMTFDNKVKDWGQIQWVKPVIEIMMSGNSEATHYHLAQIFDTLKPIRQKLLS